MDINGFNSDSYQIKDNFAIDEGTGSQGILQTDPLTMTEEEFMVGAKEFGMSEADAEKAWELLSDGEGEINQDDFNLEDFKHIDEISGSSQALMQQFIDLMMSQVNKIPETESNKSVRG